LPTDGRFFQVSQFSKLCCWLECARIEWMHAEIVVSAHTPILNSIYWQIRAKLLFLRARRSLRTFLGNSCVDWYFWFCVFIRVVYFLIFYPLFPDSWITLITLKPCFFNPLFDFLIGRDRFLRKVADTRHLDVFARWLDRRLSDYSSTNLKAVEPELPIPAASVSTPKCLYRNGGVLHACI
jgi:hypothetical protein